MISTVPANLPDEQYFQGASHDTRNGSMIIPTRRAVLVGALQMAAALVLSRYATAAEVHPRMTVTRDPACGCCGGWIEHVKGAGFLVDELEAANLVPLKTKLGVPVELSSCHTAEIGGYAIEGHVPADAIKRLLAERPQAKGLAVGGMPVGSPGMEVAGTPPETYDVVLFSADGQRVFARYRGTQAI
jgi:hypothetical protein